jgi:Rrf2 family protein
MQITKQADYAIRAVLYLSRQPEKRAPTNQIAQAMHVPPSFLAKIVAQLAVAGLIHTARGAGGGITLARDPATISLLDIVEAIDGPILLSECVSTTGQCDMKNECPLQAIWIETQHFLLDRLRAVNFGQLVQSG